MITLFHADRPLVRTVLFFVLLLPVLVIGCAFSSSPTTFSTPTLVNSPRETIAPAFKGWELYSWQKDQDWNFVLVPGTNRLKTVDEILANPNKLDPVGIGAELARLPQGEEVFWETSSGAEFVLPPAAIVRELQAVCAKQGIKLTVVAPR